MKKKEKNSEEQEVKNALADFKAAQENKIKQLEKNKHDLADLVKSGESSDKETIDYDEDEETFVCKICGKEFDDHNKLGEHMSEHY